MSIIQRGGADGGLTGSDLQKSKLTPEGFAFIQKVMTYEQLSGDQKPTGDAAKLYGKMYGILLNKINSVEKARKQIVSGETPELKEGKINIPESALREIIINTLKKKVF